VGISRCLLGGDVRYDGGHKLERPLVDALAPHVHWVEVCPEVEIGMGVPREPVRLVSSRRVSVSASVRMIGLQSGRDWTAEMTEWSRVRIRDLASMRLSGYVLKARSPSCGLHDVPIHRDEGPDPGTSGRGLFAAALVAVYPDLPIEDEERLRGPGALQEFLDRVVAFHCMRHGTP
jgi:uncharacterized protein YbbK (DUF523 family)